MSKSPAYSHFDQMEAHQMIFGYKGSLSNDLISAMIQLVDSKLKEMGISFRQKKSVINILIEALQNSLFHANEKRNEKYHQTLFMLSGIGDSFQIRVGNFIDSENEQILRKRLDHLNSLDADQIQQMYLDVLDQGKISDRGGAGLGFLRMLRDSGNPIGYSFDASDDNQVFYCIELLVKDQAGK